MNKARSLPLLQICFLRKIVGITIYDVKDHHISNKQVREELDNCYTFHQSLELELELELRRTRRLEILILSLS